MYVHESGVGYTLYIQNDKYANENLKYREAEMSGQTYEIQDTGLDDYLNQVIAAIPELKAYKENGGGIGVVILPESTSSSLKEAVSQTTDKMLEEGTDEEILKGVLGIIKYNYSGDVEYGNGVATSKNDVFTYDLESVNNVLNKFKDIYASNGALSAGLGQFSQYLNDIYGTLKSKSQNPTVSLNNSSSTNDSNSTNNKNDLVDTFIQEMDKSKDGATTGSEELNKKLYKNYIKSLTSSLTGGLLQQHS